MKRLKFLVSLMFFIAIIIPVTFSGTASLYPQIEQAFPSAYEENVPVDSDIRIRFNDKIESVATANITVWQTSSNYRIPLSIKDIRHLGNELLIILEEPFEFNQSYEVEFVGNSVSLANGIFNQHVTLPFKTNYLDFYELMVINERRLSSLLDTYSPRQIKAFAPKRYIEEISVIHKKPGALGEKQAAIGGLTNIDVRTKNEDVTHIHVDIMKDGKIFQKGYAQQYRENNNRNANYFNFDIGFSNNPDNFDVRVKALDGNQNVIDEKILKFVAEEGKLISEFKESYRYTTAGNSYTFYELLSNERLFTTLLAESSIHHLKVQVEDR